MANKRKKVPDVNTSSTADIAFLLLIFFLVTSSMDTDSGLARRLPPPPQDETQLSEIKVQRRNLLVVLVNSLNQTMVGDEHYDNLNQMQGKTGKQSLKDKVKEFVVNPNNSEDLPELFEEDFGPPVGTLRVTKDHVISLQNDNTTSYKTYLAVQNELVKAYNELRNEAAKRYYNRPYEELLTDEKDLINKVYPQRISEAEPKDYGGKKK
ncbi:MAG: biopolymer transporter ExbD [Dysgonamonadaceae bacterium]|nr:biopolymer transporter ExbD [Dysgonamonadaceae bacterium]